MAKQGEKIKIISARAKEIWKKEKGEKWTDAIKRASAELKKENNNFIKIIFCSGSVQVSLKYD